MIRPLATILILGIVAGAAMGAFTGTEGVASTQRVATTPAAEAARSGDEQTTAIDDGLLLWLMRPRWWRQVPERPDPPTVTDTSRDSLAVTWEIPANTGLEITDYDVQYRKTDDARYVDWEHAGLATEATITDLAEATVYEVRVRAANDLGPGSWSVPGVGMTTTATVRFTEGEQATRELAENPPPNNPIGAPLTATGGATLHYNLEGKDAAAFAVDAGNGQLGTQEGVDYNYESQERYVVTVHAAGSDGGDATIEVSILLTDVDEPPGPPGTPRVETALSTSIRIGWAAPENTGPPIQDYDVEYRQFGEDFVDAEYDGIATSFRLTGLQRGTRYQVQVRATNAEGTGLWSPRGDARTAGGGSGGGGSGGSGSGGSGGTTGGSVRTPVFPSTAGFTVPENTLAVGTVRASNASAHTIATGADGSAFEIDNAGALSFQTAPDYERPTDVSTSDPPDAAGNNIYVVSVVATAGSGGTLRTATHTVTVTVTDTPFEAPAISAVSVLSSTQISVSWTPRDNTGPAILDYDVHYRRAGAADFSDADHRGLGRSATLADLAPTTAHEIRVRAVNANGPSPWSESTHATTDPNRAPEFTQSPLARTLAENTPADRSIGAPLAAFDPDGDALNYRLGGRDAARFRLEADSAQLLTRTGIDYDHETRGTLNLTVTAEDGHGGRASADITIEVTDEREPPARIGRPAVSASTLSSLTIHWTPPDNTGPRITDYDYRYRRDVAGQNWTEVTNTPLTATQVTIAPLMAQTDYLVEVLAKNEEGTGDWSPTASGTTDNNQAPRFREGLSTTRRLPENTSGSTNIGAAVSATDSDGGTLVYSLEGAAASLFDFDTGSGQLSTRSSATYDHEATARHELTVRVVDGQGGSATIAVTVEITDLREPPGIPAPPTVLVESSSRLGASWSAPDNSGPPIIDYDYRYGTDGSRWTTVTNPASTATEVEIDELDPDTEYQVQVLARNDEGSSDWSGSGRATTAANQAPAFAEGATATRALPENTAADTDFDTAVTATDGNDDRLTYRLGGTDAARFALDADSGQLSTRRFDYDHEEQASYAVTVTAEDTQQATASIDVTIEITDLDEAPGAPSRPTRAGGTSTTLTMRWPAPSNTGPDIDDYDYRFRADVPGPPWNEVTNTPIDSPEVTIEDLTPDTTYQVEARAHNDEGTSPWSGTGMGKTNVNRAPAFREGTRTSRSLPENTLGSVDIGGPVEATDADDDDLSYSLGGSDAASFFLDTSNGQLSTRGSVDYDHEDKSSYQVTLEVEDAWQATDSIPVTVAVSDVLEPPVTPGRPNAYGKSPYAIEVSWSPPANAGRPLITSYDLQYGIADGGNFTGWRRTSTGTDETITGLMAETTYEVQVLARNAEGSSGWSLSGRGTSLVVVPVIKSVSFTSDPGTDDTYKLADTIEVTVRFSEDVTVNTADGEPKIDIVVGSQTRGAQYDSGSGSDELVFEYEIEGDDEDTDGASIRANSLDTNGGTIRKVGRTLAANLAHGGVTDDDDHQVDGVAPTLSGAIVNGARLTLAYSETLASSPAPAGADFDVQVAAADRSVSTVSVRGQSVLLTLASAVALDETVTVAYDGTGIRDTAGNPAPTFGSYSVSNLITAVCARTAAVRDAIVRAAGVGSCGDVTATHLQEMTALDVSSRRVSTLKDGDFDALPALERLTLEDNALSDLPAGIFSDLPSLVRLDLESNNLSTVPDVFDGLGNVLLLDLKDNGISSLPSDVFSGLTALRILWLAKNDFTTLPSDAFSDVPTVTWIDLNENELVDPDGDAFAGLSALETLWLAKNDLSSVPDGLLSGLTSLEELDLEGNAVDPLPIPVTLQFPGSQLEASIPAGAPFDTFVPIRVTNGTLAGGVSGVTVSQGDTDSASVSVQRSPGTTAAVTVDIGKLPGSPEDDMGYELVRSDDLPLEVIAGLRGIVLHPASLTVEEGGLNGYQVVLQARPSAEVSVEVTTPTGLTANPASPLTFTADDWNTPQTVTLTAATDADTSDNDVTVAHQASGGDYAGLTASLAVTVAETVADTNASPSITSGAAFAVNEHDAAVGTVVATDGDPEDNVTGFTLGGADGDRFKITLAGGLSFAAPPDFEKPEDVRSSSPANDADNNEYIVAVTAASGVGSRRRTATQTIVVTVQDLDEPPGQPPTPTVGGSSSTSIFVFAGRRPIHNTGPEIDDYDLQIREQGVGMFVEQAHDSPRVTARLGGLDPRTTYEIQVRARNDEGAGPWSPSAEATTGTSSRPEVVSSALPSGVTATAGGAAQAFHLQSAFTDPDGEFLWLEASSRNEAVATASVEGPAVVVRPLTAGQATIAVTAHDPQGETAAGTFQVTVEAPTRSDLTASIDTTGNTLTLEFTDAFALDERRSYQARVRQKAPVSGWATACFSARNTTGAAGDRNVSSEILIGSLSEPGITYEVVYRYLGASCTDTASGGWSRVTEATAPGSSSFDIEVVVVGSASSTYRSALQSAASTWERILTTSLADFDFSYDPVPADECMTGQPEVSDTVDDLRIFVRLAAIDGVGGSLAYAGPCYWRLSSGLPIISTITLDTDDLAAQSSTLTQRTILHEMGHALGFGTRWYTFSLLRNPSLDRDDNPVSPPPDTHFVGPLAVAAFDAAGGSAYMDGKVPVEHTGGTGARDGHWRESVLEHELMTPRLSRGRTQPLSAITIQSLADMGYGVDVTRAETYTLPGLAPVFAPPLEGAGEPVPGNCIVTSDSRAIDDRRHIVLPTGTVTVRPSVR